MAGTENEPALPASPFLFLLHFPFRTVLKGWGQEKLWSSQRIECTGTDVAGPTGLPSSAAHINLEVLVGLPV